MRLAVVLRLLTACLATAACGQDTGRESEVSALNVDRVRSTAGSASAPAVAAVAAAAPAALDLHAAATPQHAADGASDATGIAGGADSSAPPPAPPSVPTPERALSVGSTTSAAAVDAGAMVIRSGTASVEVDSLDIALSRVQALAARLGGYVGNTTLAGGRDQVRAATLELKLPAARFQEAVAGLSPLGRVDSVATSAQDVGEEYVDVAARTANARRLEARLLALLERRTSRLSDVVAVEHELARVREEIERYEGRLRYLRTRAAVSTLTVSVHEPYPVVGTSSAESPLRAAFRQAASNFVGLTAALIAASGVLVPVGLAGLGAWAVADRVRRRPGTAPRG